MNKIKVVMKVYRNWAKVTDENGKTEMRKKLHSISLMFFTCYKRKINYPSPYSHRIDFNTWSTIKEKWYTIDEAMMNGGNIYKLVTDMIQSDNPHVSALLNIKHPSENVRELCHFIMAMPKTNRYYIVEPKE